MKKVIENKLKSSALTELDKIFLYFLTYSFLGWILESLYAIYNLGHFVKRGFLLGPVCPIYGCGAIILILFLSKYKKNSFKLFVVSGILLSFFEYLVSFAMDALFAAKWWDYTNEFFNLNGRISIFYAFVWGIGAILFVNHIHPFVEKRVKKIFNRFPFNWQILFIYGVLFVLFIDIVSSVVINFKV